MKAWIFKAIWMPIGLIVGMVCFGLMLFIAKNVGWEVPFRWLCLIGWLAFLADKAVNP